MAEQHARSLRRDDPDYPAAFHVLGDAPAVVHVRGRLPSGPAAAIVGARAASAYGIATAERLGRDLACVGVTVVSGLARGIDAAAHRGALAAGGVTIAVIPGNVLAVTPRHHAALADAIAERGAVLSESDAPVRARGEFVRRNRLIAALGAATVVVEAAERSGALTTAAAARRLGRPVLAVPGDVDRPGSRGSNDLLREGALVCADARDVLRVVDRAGQGAPAATGEARVRIALADEPQAVEGIASRAALDPAETLAALLRLEWAGVAARAGGGRWRARG